MNSQPIGPHISLQHPTPTSNTPLLSQLPFSQHLQTLDHFRQRHLSHLRPWTTFFSPKLVRIPQDYGAAQQRAMRNFGYYKTNYAVVAGLVCLYGVVTNIWLLVAVAYTIGVRMLLFGENGASLLKWGTIQIPRIQAQGIAVGVGIVLWWWAGVGATLFWMIGASAVTIGAHAAIMEVPVEAVYADVDDTQGMSV